MDGGWRYINEINGVKSGEGNLKGGQEGRGDVLEKQNASETNRVCVWSR